MFVLFRSTAMKGILWGLFLLAQALGGSQESIASEPLLEADHTIQTFVVSAYYSPLPNQESYVKGSYEADMVLNGRGIQGADGTPVYYGMLAAPSSYEFGTKIYLPGLGVGTVHDRGGAIIEREDSHRIDVWMGFGDEGRVRAMQWGMRTINGIVYSPDVNIEDSLFEGINNISAPISILSHPLEFGFTATLSNGDKGDEVKKLQEILKEMQLYSGPVTGFFGPRTQKAVSNFQYMAGVINSPEEANAGIFGPYTKEMLEQKWQEQKSQEIARKLSPSQLVFSENIAFGDKGYEVERLQLILADLGYFNTQSTGNFGYQTLAAVQNFQKDKKIISKNTDFGAGHFGPQTKSMLESILEQKRNKITDAQNNVVRVLNINNTPLAEEDQNIPS